MEFIPPWIGLIDVFVMATAMDGREDIALLELLELLLKCIVFSDCLY